MAEDTIRKAAEDTVPVLAVFIVLAVLSVSQCVLYSSEFYFIYSRVSEYMSNFTRTSEGSGSGYLP